MEPYLFEAERCLLCKNPQCLKGCPVQTPIPHILRLTREGHQEEAARLLFENNPLTSVCSVVCPEDYNCQANCILNHTKKPIHFPEIENHLSVDFLEHFKPDVKPNNGFHVAVIGSGPAGLSLSFWLLMDGFNVTLFEAHEEMGGVLRYGIPDFRMSPTYLQKLTTHLIEMGIQFRPNTLVGPVITLDDLFNDDFDAIFIGTGTWRPKKLGVKGESMGHVIYAIDYLKHPHTLALKDHVVVIGAGNVAMDVARVVKRKGVQHVTVLNVMPEDSIAASPTEVLAAKAEGIDFMHEVSVLEIKKDYLVCTNVVRNEGKFAPIGEPFEIKAENVFISIGQGARSNLVATDSELKLNHKGLLEVKPDGSTTKVGVFTAGDVSNGGVTVVKAVAEAKTVYDSIKEYCYTIKKIPASRAQ